MKLRNILLATAVVAFSSTACAASAGALSQGGTYIGLAGGWGSLTKYTTNLGDSESITSGGFSGRVYLGYLMSVNTASSWMFGPELGYSYYANNTYMHGDEGYSSNIKQSGYGVDALFNATYMFNNVFNIAVKPGFQYSFEKTSYTSSYTYSTEHFDEPYYYYYASNSSSRVLPEVNVEANWQAFAGKPFFLGASYQYVWGDDTTATNTSVASRDMFALNLEYLFN